MVYMILYYVVYVFVFVQKVRLLYPCYPVFDEINGAWRELKIQSVAQNGDN